MPKQKYDCIILNDWRFWGCHGVYEEEKIHPQEFRVDIELYLDLAKAEASDDLQHTVDYARLYCQVKKLVEESSYNLLESLAGAIARLVLAHPLAVKAQVKVGKCRIDLEEGSFSPQIMLLRSREDYA